MEISLADILTIPGAAGAAALVTGMVEVAKRLAPRILAAREQVAAAALAALLVAMAMAARVSAMPPATLEGAMAEAFLAIVAWYGITRLAMAIHDDASAAPGSLTGPQG